MIRRADLLAIAKDRTAVILLGATFVGLVFIILTTLLRVHASDVQVPIRYSEYGTANIYRDQWYVLYTFPIFALLVVLLNSALNIKIHQLNRMVGIGLMSLTLFLVIVCLVVANAIFNLAPSV